MLSQMRRRSRSRNRGYRRRSGELKEFAREYREKKAALKPAPAKGKGKGRGKAAVPKRPQLPKEIGTLSQVAMKAFMPPGSFLWQSRGLSWHSKVPPFSETSRSWAKYGQENACFRVVKEAWSRHLMCNGMERAECPVEGIFDE